MNPKKKIENDFGFDVTYDPALDEYAETLKPSSKLAAANEAVKTPEFQKMLKEWREEIEANK